MSDVERRLAAIMFTDIVGYSALTGRDEMLAMELLREHHELLRPVFGRHGGVEVKTIGDSFMVEFPSVVNAVGAAVEMQQTLADRNSAESAQRQLMVRIGIHVGDVILRENDVFGDGVNIASRIEPLAQPGGICVSEDVARQIRNKIAFPVTEIGSQRESMSTFSSGFLLTRQRMEWFNKQYVPAGAEEDPRAAPLLATDLTGLAPAYVSTSEADILRDEGEAYARRLMEAGVEVRYDRLPVAHSWFNQTRSRSARTAHGILASNVKSLLNGST